ncbi:unnamed protein product [Cladocopium goreaui]|uniref:rRNA methyltransferase 1, mitochondrial n=1 Tax=Cladocopium goreaui TaxID=2562237 RepID=A0A9P1BMN8_9DINO|nr:unnamed protein product [Cladocopium goreaui]
MGLSFTKIWTRLVGKQDRKIVMVGLDAAGKTTVLYQLKLQEVLMTIPTIGFNVETVEYRNIRFTVWDIGGQDKIRSLWKHYFLGAHGVIFVLDSSLALQLRLEEMGNFPDMEILATKSSDRKRVQEAREELWNMLRDTELEQAACLILANKQDLPEAMSCKEVAEELQLHELRSHRGRHHVQPTSAAHGALGDPFGPKKAALGRSFEGLPEFVQQEADWNARHHVLHSSANHEFHESDKEYFSIFLAARNKRVGLCRSGRMASQHTFSLIGFQESQAVRQQKRQWGKRGADDPETAAEKILRPDDVVRVPEVPGSTLMVPSVLYQMVPPLCNMFAIDLHGTTCTFSLPSRPPARRAPRNVPVPGAPRARGAAGREEGQYGKSDYLYGVYPVLLALRAKKRKFKRLWVQGTAGPTTLEKKDTEARSEILRRSRELGVPTVTQIQRQSILDYYSDQRPHQGLVLKCSPAYVRKIEDLPSPRRGAIWLALEGITDHMNLGSLLRSAAFFGVEGVICERGCAKYTPVAAKASAGAGEMISLFQVRKMQSLLPRARAQGWCVLGAALPDAESQVAFSPLDDFVAECNDDHAEAVVLLLGPEGPGLRAELKECCDRLVGISRVGDSGDGLDSLNAGVAAGVFLHALRQALPRPG